MSDVNNTPLLKKKEVVAAIITGVFGVIAAIIYIVATPGGQPEDPESQKFPRFMLEYADAAKKAWLDVIDRGCRDDDKCASQRAFEDLYVDYHLTLRDAETACPSAERSLADLNCANSRMYSLYDAIEEGKSLVEELDCERLTADCLTSLGLSESEESCQLGELKRGWPLLARDPRLLPEDSSSVAKLKSDFRALQVDFETAIDQVVEELRRCE